jgi:hypothetical protein
MHAHRRALLLRVSLRWLGGRRECSARISLNRLIMRALYAFFLVGSLAALVAGSPSSTTTTLRSAAMAAPSLTASGAQSEAQTAGDTLSDTHRANEVLDGLKARYRGLDGVRVVLGETPRGEQAVAYYTEGRIVISRSHSVTIDKILAHEIWHIIDWRDNGQLDWNENLPPYNSSDYLLE